VVKSWGIEGSPLGCGAVAAEAMLVFVLILLLLMLLLLRGNRTRGRGRVRRERALITQLISQGIKSFFILSYRCCIANINNEISG
jgi:hypothetical protein